MKTTSKTSPKRAASMKAAASMLGVPLPWVSEAKAAGCLGFNAKGSVLLEPVREWITKNQAALESKSGELSLRDQRLTEQVRQLRLRNDREAGTLVPIADILAQDAAACSRWNSERMRVEQEWPPRLAGKDIPECRTVLRELTSSIGGILKGIRS